MRAISENRGDVFENYIHEDVMFCNINDNLGGIQASSIYYCYQPFISTLIVPSPVASNQDAGKITRLSLFENRGFSKIESLVETPVLDSEFKDSGSPSDSSTLEFYILGVRDRLMGLSRKLRYRPFTFLVLDNNGKKFLFGTLESPAYLKNFKIETGKKFDDNCGALLKFTSNTLFYEFEGEIPIVPVQLGDFDSDFDSDFY